MGCTCNKALKSTTLDINEEQENYMKEREAQNLDEINIGETIINGNENENENEEINEKNNPPLKSLKKKNDFVEDEIIKNFYEKINELEDYEIFPKETIDTFMSPDSLNSYNYYENNRGKFNEIENLNNNNIPNSFKMPPIKNKKTEEIYQGNYIYDKDNDDYKKIGEGKLVTKDKSMIILNSDENISNYENSKVFYNNGDIFIGDISKKYPYEKEKGTLFYKDNNNDFSSFLKCENYKSNPIKIKKVFPNKDEYEGDSIIIDNKIILEGIGKYKRKSDNSIYEGEFKKNQFNGKGNLFIPLENNDNYKSKTIITNWINGNEYGKGIIKLKDNNNEKNINCVFRFGKIIYSLEKARKPVKFHKNIYKFLNNNEIYQLAKNTKMKSMLEYLKENGSKDLNYFQFIDLIQNVNKRKYKRHNSKILNDKILKFKISNISNILNNQHNNKISFIPIQAYKTNGGQVEDRYRYQNIFNPKKTKTYTSHYLHNKRNDIVINGVINYNMFKKCNDNEIENKINLSQNENENEYILSEIIKQQEKYISHFEENDNIYPECDKYRDIIDNRNLIIKENIIGNVNNYFFSLHYISVFIPKKYNYYSFINLPCHFLTVYIHENDDLKSEESSIEINENVIIQNKKSIDNIYNKYSEKILLIEKNEGFSYIEFDTNSQSDKSKKLLCLIEINNINDNNNPYIISLKKYYHFGRFLTVKLIDQNSMYGTINLNCIDFGTINFYGEVYEIN